jgi:NDP-sugar pyrophosphorylase family protein
MILVNTEHNDGVIRMKAILLVGGLGTRLRPLTFAIPKPLLAVGKIPILQLIIEQLSKVGCSEIILATGYLSELIETFCGDGTRFGIKISSIKESKSMGTAGPISLIRERITKDEFFILMNGDIVTHLDFLDMYCFASRHDFDLTVGYVHHTHRLPFGVLTIDNNNEVIEVTEKPEFHYCISSGIYVLKGSVLEYVPNDQFFTVPDLIRELRSHQCKVGAYFIKEFWMGVENLDDIEKCKDILNAEAHEQIDKP